MAMNVEETAADIIYENPDPVLKIFKGLRETEDAIRILSDKSVHITYDIFINNGGTNRKTCNYTPEQIVGTSKNPVKDDYEEMQLRAGTLGAPKRSPFSLYF